MDDDTVIGTISQRARGVYLAHFTTSRDGLEGWEAFATLAEAKRWCAHQMGRKRLPWVEERKPDYRPRWIAEVVE